MLRFPSFSVSRLCASALSLVLSLMAFSSALAQDMWTSHLSFAGSSFSAAVGSTPVVGNSVGLFQYDETEGSLLEISKANSHLSGSELTAVGADDAHLFVGYSDGTIDFVDVENGGLVSIPELALSSSYVLKSIQTFCVNGNRLYCGFPSGILEVNIKKEEIRSVWRVTSSGVNVSSICVSDGKIFAATPDGIYFASLSNQVLENSKSWSHIDAIKGNVASIVAADGRLYAAVGKVGGECSIVVLPSADSTEPLVGANLSSFRHLLVCGSSVYAVCSGGISSLSPEGDVVSTLSHFANAEGQALASSVNLRSASVMSDGRFVIADANLAMVVASTQGVGYARRPDGPVSNVFTRLATAGNSFYSVENSRTDDYNTVGAPASLHIYRDGHWKFLSGGWREAVDIAIDPLDDSQMFVSSWGTGIFKVENDAYTLNYSASNSPLSDIFGGDGYVRTDALAYDNEHNLYILQAGNQAGLTVLDAQGQWYAYSYGPMTGAHSNTGMIVTSSGNIWMWGSRKSYTLAIANLGGTFDDPSDDHFWATSSSTDKQFLGSFQIMDASSNETLLAPINDVAEDADGKVWVATSSGILVCAQDDQLFRGAESVIMNRVRVPRNDGTDLADYLLDGKNIRCIVVDGGNRKWIGTEDDGVYLVSPDGYETIHHFTAANSPLLSDCVIDVAVRPTDGEVFFATSRGLQSFHGDASKPEPTMGDINVYPNPVSIRNCRGYVSFTGLEAGSHVFVTDVAGHRMFYQKSNGGMARWDLHRPDGGRCATGVYIVWVSSSDGANRSVAKVLVTE